MQGRECVSIVETTQGCGMLARSLQGGGTKTARGSRDRRSSWSVFKATSSSPVAGTYKHICIMYGVLNLAQVFLEYYPGHNASYWILLDRAAMVAAI